MVAVERLSGRVPLSVCDWSRSARRTVFVTVSMRPLTGSPVMNGGPVLHSRQNRQEWPFRGLYGTFGVGAWYLPLAVDNGSTGLQMGFMMNPDAYAESCKAKFKAHCAKSVEGSDERNMP